ncbi:MAG: hypothetical protein LBD14_06355 [Puniceicoccales bacterium]|jgi:hypothetical protein|nr:hypothetical protein [Puniceicoccales bacterium]
MISQIRSLVCFLFAVVPAVAHVRADPVVITTADGLPVEVELLGIYQDAVRVRYVASKTEDSFTLAELDKKTRESLNSLAGQRRKEVKAITINVEEVRNDTPRELVVTRRTAQQPAKESSSGNTEVRTLSPGSRCLRVSAMTNSGVDLPVELRVYWFGKTKASTSGLCEGGEVVPFTVTGTMGDFLTKSPTFAKTLYSGYAVLVTNPANGAVLAKKFSEVTLLQEAEKRSGIK